MPPPHRNTIKYFTPIRGHGSGDMWSIFYPHQVCSTPKGWMEGEGGGPGGCPGVS